MKKFLAAVILMLSMCSLACAEPARNLSTSVDGFGWKYFATLDKNENIFYSPYGLDAALSILANGASGDTRTEILHALDADNVENLNDEHKRFAETIAATYKGDNLFMESNLLLVDKAAMKRGLDKNFKFVVKDVYKSDVQKANFGGDLDGVKQKITRWVSKKTKGFIADYKSIATQATLTDLLNVVYFKGKWAMPFEVNQTAKQTFTNRDGSTAVVDMMNKTFDSTVAYRDDGKFKAVVLPYSAGAVMYAIMPTADADLNVAEAWSNRTPDYRADFLNQLGNEAAFMGTVVVSLPKFELDIENSLVENLKAMGVVKSFTNDAQFMNIINDTPLRIDNIQHRAKVKVDEQGTEASAVTEIIAVGLSAEPEPPRRVYFIAERPFLFMIRDVESNVTLFTGVVNKF